MLTSGRLSERLTIRRAQETELEDGSVSKTWTILLTTFCDVEQKNGSIDVIASQDNIEQVMFFTLRYRRDIPFIIGDRIEWRGRDFKIHSFDWDKNRTKLTIIAKTHNETTQP